MDWGYLALLGVVGVSGVITAVTLHAAARREERGAQQALQSAPARHHEAVDAHQPAYLRPHDLTASTPPEVSDVAVAVVPEGLASVRESWPLLALTDGPLVVIGSRFSDDVVASFEATTAHGQRVLLLHEADDAGCAGLAAQTGAMPLSRRQLAMDWVPSDALGHVRAWRTDAAEPVILNPDVRVETSSEGISGASQNRAQA